MLTPQMKEALIRGFLIALFVGTSTALGIWGQQNVTILKPIIVGSCTAFLTTLGARFGIEGMYDSKRNDAGEVKPSDVTPNVVVPVTGVPPKV